MRAKYDTRRSDAKQKEDEQHSHYAIGRVPPEGVDEQRAECGVLACNVSKPSIDRGGERRVKSCTAEEREQRSAPSGIAPQTFDVPGSRTGRTATAPIRRAE